MKRTSPWISSLFLLFIAACTGGSDRETKAGKPPQVNNQPGVNEESRSFEEHFPLYFEWIKRGDPSFSADSLIETETSVQQSLPAYPVDTAQWKPFQSTLIYNSDQSKAIDLFSSNYILSNRNGVPSAEPGEPDTEVILLDLKNGKARRIWFSGPNAVALDAAWVNGEEIAIAGVQENEKGERRPTIWLLSLNNNTINTYTFQQLANLAITDYLNRRYSGIHFR